MPLREIDLHITNRCNLNCIHCALNSGKSKLLEIGLDQIINCLDEAKNLGLKELHITGGEPLLRKDLFEIIKEAKKRKLVVQLQTNGTLLNDETIKKIRYYSVDWVMISIDGASEETNKFIRRGNYTYKNLFYNIEKLLSQKIKVRVNTVILRRNASEVFQLLKMTMKMGVHLHSFFYFSPMGRAKNLWEEWLTPLEWLELANNMRQFYFSVKTSTKVIFEKGYVLSSKEIKKLSLDCRIRKRDFCFVRCDGNVFPCVLFSDSDYYSLGNIIREKFVFIWLYSKKWKIYTPRDTHECKKCKHFYECNGGCKGFAYLKTKNLHTRDTRCQMEKGIFPTCPVINSDLEDWREFTDQTVIN